MVINNVARYSLLWYASIKVTNACCGGGGGCDISAWDVLVSE